MAPRVRSAGASGSRSPSAAHVAKDLGVHKEALRGWVRQAEADAGERDDRLTTAEDEELKQLRKDGSPPVSSAHVHGPVPDRIRHEIGHGLVTAATILEFSVGDS
ncbi:transposase [Streptomyces sp. NPDC002550]